MPVRQARSAVPIYAQTLPTRITVVRAAISVPPTSTVAVVLAHHWTHPPPADTVGMSVQVLRPVVVT